MESGKFNNPQNELELEPKIDNEQIVTIETLLRSKLTKEDLSEPTVSISTENNDKIIITTISEGVVCTHSVNTYSLEVEQEEEPKDVFEENNNDHTDQNPNPVLNSQEISAERLRLISEVVHTVTKEVLFED